MGPAAGAVEKVKHPETAWDRPSWCDTGSDTPGATLQGQFQRWLPAHRPSPQYLVQLPESGGKAASPVEDMRWLKH